VVPKNKTDVQAILAQIIAKLSLCVEYVIEYENSHKKVERQKIKKLKFIEECLFLKNTNNPKQIAIMLPINGGIEYILTFLTFLIEP